MRKLWRATSAIAVITAGLVAGTTAAPASATPAPLTIALITDLTGANASSFSGAQGIFDARIALQNTEGGVNGHKLVPLVLDDQTSPSAVVTAVQDALSHHVIGIVSESPLFFLADKYPQEAGIPVTGSSTDGPEWGEQPFTNMFAADTGSVDPTYPSNTMYGKVLTRLGGTKLAAYGYSAVPVSSRATDNVAVSFERLGGNVAIKDNSIPLGGQDFTTLAIQAKQAGVNAMWPSLAESSDIALAQAYSQEGVSLRSAAFPNGYDPKLINSPAWASVQGAVFDTIFHPFAETNPGTKEMQSALEKYAHWSKSEFPTFEQDNVWIGADLMIRGLQAAGSNPTPASVVKSLRNIKSYNGNGLLGFSIDYSTIFGHNSPTCVWLFRAEAHGFVLVQKAPVCGTNIPGTGTPAPTSS